MAVNCYGVVCLGWEYLHPQATADHLGYLPAFIDNSSDAPVAQQIDAGYVSGWNPIPGKWQYNTKNNALKYPDDPWLFPIAKYFHKPTSETLFFYDHAVCCVVQKDGSFEVARVD